MIQWNLNWFIYNWANLDKNDRIFLKNVIFLEKCLSWAILEVKNRSLEFRNMLGIYREKQGRETSWGGYVTISCATKKAGRIGKANSRDIEK